jgi:hypothetical protein
MNPKYEWTADGKGFTPLSLYRVAQARHERLVAMRAPRFILGRSEARLRERFEQALVDSLKTIIATSK